MGTTAEKLAYLDATKTAIKDAIVAKGVEIPEGTTFRGYADLIAGISAGESITLETGTATTVDSGKFSTYTFTVPIENMQALFVCVYDQFGGCVLGLSLPDGTTFESEPASPLSINISRNQSSITVSGHADSISALVIYYYAKILYNN